MIDVLGFQNTVPKTMEQWCIQKDKLKSLLSVSSLAAKFGDHLFSSNLVERPSFLCRGYDLLWWQDEPVEDTWDAANLIVFPMDCMESIVASEGKVIHCIV